MYDDTIIALNLIINISIAMANIKNILNDMILIGAWCEWVIG